MHLVQLICAFGTVFVNNVHFNSIRFLNLVSELEFPFAIFGLIRKESDKNVN